MTTPLHNPLPYRLPTERRIFHTHDLEEAFAVAEGVAAMCQPAKPTPGAVFGAAVRPIYTLSPTTQIVTTDAEEGGIEVLARDPDGIRYDERINLQKAASAQAWLFARRTPTERGVA